MTLESLPKHHAILIIKEERHLFTEKLWNELTLNSPAHTLFSQTVLDIDTARKIISWAKSPYNKERFALISFHTAGIPAQNALLKILEEPQDGVRFIIVTSNKDALLETVLSRLEELHQEKKNSSHEAYEKLSTLFLSTPHSMRIKLPEIVGLLSKVDEEGRKDRESVREFILSLTTQLQKEKNMSSYSEEVFEIASYSGDSSASGKALLDYLSLLLPVLPQGRT